MDAILKIEIVRSIPGIIGAIGGVAAAIIGMLNRAKLENIHIDIDGRMGQLLTAAHAAGALAEIKDQRAQDILGRDRASVVAQAVADTAAGVAAELVITTAAVAAETAPAKPKTRLRALLESTRKKSKP